MFGKIDKTLALSLIGHTLVIGWGLVSFSSRALDAPPVESMPIDIVSVSDLQRMTKGIKDAPKADTPKQLVEKVAEEKPAEDAVGKVTEKKEIVTSAAPETPPKPFEKPVEKKPEPPKPPEPKELPKQPPMPPEKKVEKKEEPKVDPIAEALKKAETKKPKPKETPKEAAKAQPKQQPKQERVFDRAKIAALLDKRDPTRAAATGAQLNDQPSMGSSRGNAADNSATWGAMFKSQVERCWKKPYGGIETQQIEAVFTIKLRRDGTLESNPVPIAGTGTPFFRVYQESALRAIIECQPYRLPAAYFDEWKFFEPVFTERAS